MKKNPGSYRISLIFALSLTMPFVSAHAQAPPACTLTPTNQVTITECSGTLPLFSAADAGGPASTTGYLTSIQAVQSSDSNIPLQIVNQSNSTGGGTIPPAITGGIGGIDIIQNATAVV